MHAGDRDLILQASYRRDRWDVGDGMKSFFPKKGYACGLQLFYGFDVGSWFERRKSIGVSSVSGPDMPATNRSTVTPPDYGIDAPGVVRNLFIVAVVGFAIDLTARFGLWSGVIAHIGISRTGLFVGLGCGFMGCWMIYDSKVGKLRERDRLLDLVPWRGTEAVLDLGCGRGLLLIGAARRLTTGRATGLDLWQSEDLTGNTPNATLDNARREGVADRVEVCTGDMRKMPFADASFDLVVSNVAIHNIYDREGRETTMGEIVRVLRPGGRVVIHDIRYVGDYAAALRKRGLTDVNRVGSIVARIALLLITFGSLRPDIVTARAAAA